MSPPRTLLLASVFLLPLLSSCDQIAVLDGTRAREADAVAVGSACRHAGRALEDCFNMNPDAPKAQVFAGWKEMNDYMTEKKIDVIAPTPVKPAVKPAPKAAAPEIQTGATEGKLIATSPDERTYEFTTFGKGDRVTDLAVHVGTTGDKDKSFQLIDAIKVKL